MKEFIKTKHIVAYFVIISFILIPKVSNLSVLDFLNILTEEDYRFEEEDTEPGVIILDPYQEYKSYWYCFKEPTIELRCLDWATGHGGFDDAPLKQDASITIYEHGVTFDFSLNNQEMRYGCASQLEEWNEIIKEREDICIYAAFLQYEEFVDKNNDTIGINYEYVILDIYAVKTEYGIWSYFTDGRIPGTDSLDGTVTEEILINDDALPDD